MAGQDSGNGAHPANDDAFPSIDSFASIDLRGGLGDWSLTGPRPIVWDVDSPAPDLHVKGTATAFVELRAAGSPGIRRIRIRGEYGARLQVSIVKLSTSRPRLRVNVRLVDTRFSPGTAATDVTANRALQVRVVGGDETPLTLETLACERNQGNTKQSVCFQAERLSSLLQADLELRPGERFERTYLLPIPSPTDDETPLLFKAVARDSRGRRAVAVITIDESEVGVANLRIAESSSRTGRIR